MRSPRSRTATLLATGLQPVVLLSQLAVQQADAYIRTATRVPRRSSRSTASLIDKNNTDKYTLFGLKD